MNEAQIAEFRQRFDAHLPRVAEQLEGLIRTYLDGIRHIDRIAARAKDPDRFAAKARKTKADGTPKYSFPLTQVQDQIGARVIVFYPGDVEVIRDCLVKYFTFIEEKKLVPDSQWSFGYFGHHWVFALPDDVIPPEVNRDEVPRFFELQVKTLFQHAWSEANHDLGYKAAAPLTSEQERLLAFTSAQAWGADNIFERLCQELKGLN
jgi:putative GTP pyrophosphokinase